MTGDEIRDRAGKMIALALDSRTTSRDVEAVLAGATAQDLTTLTAMLAQMVAYATRAFGEISIRTELGEERAATENISLDEWATEFWARALPTWQVVELTIPDTLPEDPAALQTRRTTG